VAIGLSHGCPSCIGAGPLVVSFVDEEASSHGDEQGRDEDRPESCRDS
jgi:hypothetical protein